MQKIRDHFGKAVIINSAYRTASHNSKVGGSPKSQHVQGKAADIRINGADPLLVAQYAESIGLGGIGLYDTFTHVDTRATKSKWDYRNGQKAVTSFGGQGQFKEKEKKMDHHSCIKDLRVSAAGKSADLKAVLVAGEHYIRLRDIAPLLGYSVDWDGAKQAANLVKQG